MRDSISKNREHADAQNDQQTKTVTDIRIELDDFKDKEIVRKTISDEKDSKTDARIGSLEENSEKVHSELISLTEQAENSRKAVSKIHGQIEEFDEQICQLAADRQHDGDSLNTLRTAIGDLEKLLQVLAKVK